MDKILKHIELMTTGYYKWDGTLLLILFRRLFYKPDTLYTVEVPYFDT